MFLAQGTRPAFTSSFALALALFAGSLAAQGGTVITEVEITPPLGVGDQNWPNSITSIGDLDNDGVDDLAVGHKYDDGAGAGDEGSVWILFMNADRTVSSAVEIDAISPSGDDEFGAAVAWLGDLDGVGGSAATLAVGAPGAGTAGVVHLLFLNSSGGVDSSSLIDGDDIVTSPPDSGFGVSIATIGDVDGPGGSEQAIAVGVRAAEVQNQGAVHVIFLDGSGNVTDSEEIPAPGGSLAFDQFGDAVAGLGDLDGDGIPDLAVGHPLDANQDGAVHIFFLETDGSVAVSPPPQKILGFETGDGFGRSVTAIDDLDGDGVQDLLVGADLDNADGDNGGSVWAVFLDTDGTVSGMQRITEGIGGFTGPLDSNAHFGAAVATLGDLDGDFRPDIAVCAGDPTTFPTLDSNDGEIWMLELEISQLTSTFWNGSMSSEWDNPGNWSNGVPSPFVDTFITSGTNPCSTLGASSPACGNLSVGGGGSLSVEGSALSVTGDVSLTGNFSEDVLTVDAPMTVFGSVSLSGSSSELVGTSHLIVDGDVTVGILAELPSPTPDITLTGNWSTSSETGISEGTVTFNGSGSQTVGTISGATVVPFFNISVPPGSDVTFLANNDIIGDLAVEGTLTTTGNDLVVGGATTGSGSLVLGSLNHFAGDFSFDGALSASGPITFNGGDTQTVATTILLDAVEVDSEATVEFEGALQINSLALLNGLTSLEPGNITQVGSFTGSQGEITGTGLLDVAGDVTLNETIGDSPPDIEVAGNWIDNTAGGFAPTSGKVTFDGGVSQAITTPGPAATFFEVEVAGLADVSGTDLLIGGTLTSNGALSADTLDVDDDVLGTGSIVTTTSFSIADTVDFSGAITGGPVTLDGGSQSVSFGTNLPSTIVDTSVVTFAGNHAIQGDLELVDGTMQLNEVMTVEGNLIANSATATALIISNGVLRVDGTATMNEGLWIGDGILDLDGPATIGANAQFEFGSVELAQLEVSGDLDMDATLPETTVTFDGSSPQSVTGSPTFFNLVVGPTADLTVGSVPITGDLVVHGAFDGNDIAVQGEVSGSGVFDVSSKAQFLGDFSFDGTMLAAGLFFMGADQLVTSPNLPFVVQGAPGGTLTFGDGAGMDVLSLNSLSGNIVIAPDATVAINTAASLGGGTLSGEGTLQILGDADFNGTVVNSPDIEIGGDLTVDENWNPMSGTVTFNGAGGQNIFLGGLASEAPFFAMTVAGGTDVTAGGGVPVTTAGLLTVDGGTLKLDGGLDADGEVTGDSGTLDLTVAPTVKFGGGYSFLGNLQTGGMVLFDGPGPNFITVDTTFDNGVDVDMTGGILTFAADIGITGDLHLFPTNMGDLLIAANTTTSITGNALLEGGSLSGSGLLTATGMMTFGGTSMNSPDLALGGDLSIDENFNPLSGVVTFNGGGALQTITVTGSAPDAQFNDVVLDVGANVEMDTMQSFDLDIDGDLTIDDSAALSVGQDVKIGHSLVLKGTLSSSTMVVFDGSGTDFLQSFPPHNPLPTVDINKDPGGEVEFLGTELNIAGRLNVLSGTLVIADSNKNVSVQGDGMGPSLFSGGFLSSEGADDIDSGVIDFAEGVRFEGTSVTAPPDLELEGDWSSNAAFAPTLGLVTFDGSAVSPQDLSVNGGASVAQFYHLRVAAGARIEHSVPIDTKGPCDADGELICTDPNEGSLVLLDVDAELTGTGTVDFGLVPPQLGGMTFSGTPIGLTAVIFDGDNASDAFVLSTPLTLPDVTISGAGTLTITSDLDVTGDIDLVGMGTLVASTGAVDATGDLNLSSGSFVLAAGNTTTVDVADMSGGAIGGAGTLVTTDELVINTSGTVMFDGDGLEIEKDLRLVSGTLEVTGNTTTIGGIATFQGGVLTGDGLLDIGGDMTFEGTAATAPPSIELEGNWDVDANWAPTTGTVFFDGPPTQTVTSDVSPALFHGFCVLAGSTVDLVDPVQIDGPFTVDGTVDVSLGADVNGGLGGTGTLTIDAAAPLEVGGDFTFAGNLIGESDLILDGAGAHVVNTNVIFEDVTFDSAGSYSVQASNFFLTGDLEIASGDIVFESGSSILAAGDGDFNGGSLVSLSPINILGNVDFTGTSVAGDLSLACAGDWTSDAGFAPIGGTVTITGAGAHSVTTSQTDFEWASLFIDTGAVVDTGKDVTTLFDLTVKGTLTADSATSVTVGGDLDVDGTFSASSASLDVGGDFLLDPAGSLTTGGTLYTFGGDYLEQGTFTHPSGATVFTFDSAAPITIAAEADQALPGVSLQGTGAVSLDSGGATAIDGDLTLAAASFGTEDALVVAGDANFLGGAWDGTSSPLDVAGHVTFGGTVAAGSYDIDCAGDWTADAQFAPTGGTLTLDGVGDTLVSGAGLFRDLVISNGKRTVLGVSSISTDSISVGVGAELDLGTRSTEVAVGPLTVDGALRVGSGGELALASSVAATVSTTGTLSLLSSFPQEAAIRALGAPGYSFSVAGGLEAMNFRIQEMDASGFVIASTATIGAAPNDFRGGVFDLPSSSPGSVLLDVSQAAPTTFQYLTFEDTLAQGTANVRTTPGSADIAFQNFAGAFAGEDFDDDGLDQLDWLAPSTSSISSFEATPEPGRVVLEWTSATEINNVSYVLLRQRIGGAAMVTVGEVAAVGPSSYRFTDHVVQGHTEYAYFLDERLTHGALQELATTTTKTQAVSPTQPRLFQVQSGQGANAIADTLARVLVPDSTLLVSAGAYNSFTIAADLPPGLRIVASEPGVVIHTATGPVTFEGLELGQTVELAGLSIAAPPTDHPALLIRNSRGIVLLDELTARGGLNSPAVRIEDSERVAIQSPDFEPSLHASESHALSIRDGSIGQVVLDHGSTAVLTGVETSLAATPDASALQLDAAEALLSFERSAKLGEWHPLVLEAEPGSAFALFAAGGLGWLDASFPAVDPFLLDVRRALLVEAGAIDAPAMTLGLTIPSEESFAQRSWLMQALILDPFAAEARLTNVRSLAAD